MAPAMTDGKETAHAQMTANGEGGIIWARVMGPEVKEPLKEGQGGYDVDTNGPGGTGLEEE